MSESLPRLTAALAERYHIERELGRGGMATVYLAHDLRHGREVAIKVLLPELAAALGTERFLQEIRIAAGLTHPNITPLYDSGEAGGFLYYVMPYLTGETLRSVLHRERQLGLERALQITRTLAAALDYAHQRGVIHRDIKPENILLHADQPMLLDFGIALAVSEAGGARLTGTGLSLGTPAYMSPEQATGSREVDARTDVYALGGVLYEMLAGDPPFAGPNVQAVIARIVSEPPARLRQLRAEVPAHVDAAVHRALAKVPADRFATAGEFAAALTPTVVAAPVGKSRRVRWVSVAGAAAAVLIAATVLLRMGGPREAGASPADEARTAVVLPFTFRGSQELAYLQNGMIDLLAADLSSGGELLTVEARQVLAALGGADVETLDPDRAREVAQRLAAGLYVLGSIVEVGGRVRVSASVYDRSRGARPVATRTEEGDVAGVLGLARRLSGELVSALAAAASRVTARLAWSGDSVDLLGSVSSDARLLSFTDWYTGDLAIRDLDAGTTRRLTNKGSWEASDEFAEFSRVSPDGRLVAYAWFKADWGYDLRVVETTGGEPRTLLTGRPFTWLMPMQWSRDGGAVLVTQAESSMSVAGWVSVATAVMDTLRVNRDAAGWPVASPDGRWIAYGREGDIGVTAADGSRDGLVVVSPARDEVVSWMPDGRHLLFWSDRGQAPGLWQVPVADGQAIGEPAPVRSSMGNVLPLGFAGNRFYYGVGASEVRVQVASVDFENGEVVEPPAPISYASAQTISWPSWSLDGGRMSYIVEPLYRGQRGRLLVVRDVRTGAVREYALGIRNPQQQRWLPRQNALVILGADPEGTWRWHRLDLETGSLDTVLTSRSAGNIYSWDLRYSPDGRSQYLGVWRADRTASLVRRDVQSGRESVLFSGGSRFSADLSADGRWLAVTTRNADTRRHELRVLPSAGGEARLVLSVAEPARLGDIRWSPDGRYLLVVRFPGSDSDDPEELWRVRVADGDARTLLRARGLRRFAIHPDGRRIAYTSGQNRREVWIMEDIAAPR